MFSGILLRLINREQSLKNVYCQGSNFLTRYLMSIMRLVNVIRFLEVFQWVNQFITTTHLDSNPKPFFQILAIFLFSKFLHSKCNYLFCVHDSDNKSASSPDRASTATLMGQELYTHLKYFF